MGRFVGPIYVVILIVDIFFFALLEFVIPRTDIDYVPEECDWTQSRYHECAEVRVSDLHILLPRLNEKLFSQQQVARTAKVASNLQ